MTTTITTSWRELDDREADAGALRIALLWHPETQRTLVSVLDRRTGEQLHIEPEPGQRASQIYRHPFAYADQAWETSDRGPNQR